MSSLDPAPMTIADDGVATITLSDPDRRNALQAGDEHRTLARAIERATRDDARAIVLAAQPPVFSAGGSLDDLARPGRRSR